MAEVVFAFDGQPSPMATACDGADGSIALPLGFCAIVVATDLPGARHVAIASNGDVFLARAEAPGLTAMRDLDGDATMDTVVHWNVAGSNDVLLFGEHVYLAERAAIRRYQLSPGALVPSGPAVTIVDGLPATLNHSIKSIAIGRDSSLYVSIGAPGNSCMAENAPGSPGLDPCPLLVDRGGVWRFDIARTGQRQSDGRRHATGLRHVVALGMNPATDVLYGVMHGRDQLHDLWPALYSQEESAELPSEEFIRIDEGSDFGWPYCYHDRFSSRKVLAPEYGGDGVEQGRCVGVNAPLIAFPAHWAPNDLEFYTGDQFPTFFREGAFVAFHGSWNRAPLPQQGYNVVFVPADFGSEWMIFADGFRTESLLGRGRSARPVGVAMGPDGSLYISDSINGSIWRVVYAGP